MVMTKLINVQLRVKTYHFRMNIPVGLQKYYGRTAHTTSLDTEDPLEASKKADILVAKYKAKHKGLRSSAKEGTDGKAC